MSAFDSPYPLRILSLSLSWSGHSHSFRFIIIYCIALSCYFFMQENCQIEMQKVDINLGSPLLKFPFWGILKPQPNSPSFPFKKLFRPLPSLSIWELSWKSQLMIVLILGRWAMGKNPDFHSFFFLCPFCFDALFEDSELGFFFFSICVLFLIYGLLFIDASITVGDVRFEPLAVMRSTPVAIVITKLRSVLVVDWCS